MSQSTPEHAPQDSTTENPIAAVGRKVKSALRSSQQPSIRIQRTYGDIQDIPANGSLEKPSQNDTVAPKDTTLTGRFRSLFSGSEGHTEDDFAASRDKYDNSVVDLLDVIGKYF